MAAEIEDVSMEVEAVQAVYAEDCVVIDPFPPHLRVLIKPRTADVTSQQFVEAVIRIQGNSQYPKDPPLIDVVDSKGLDEKRKKSLETWIQNKACELSSCLMLVTLCEEAVEKLSSLNYPDGDCPLCLYPLVPDKEKNDALPFMKLMSCFHCFHSECMIRWWNWLGTEKDTDSLNSYGATLRRSQALENKKGTKECPKLIVSSSFLSDMFAAHKDEVVLVSLHTQREKEEGMGNCPVCRKVFHASDLEHVIDIVATLSHLSLDDNVSKEDEKLLLSDSENKRRQKFENLLMLQKENEGIIEPKKPLSIVSGMFLPQPVPTTTSNKESEYKHHGNSALEAQSSGSSNRADANRYSNSNMKRHKARNLKQPAKQWIRKSNGTAE